MKILLLGKNGQVGWELQRSLAPLGEVIALDRHSTGHCGDLSNLQGLAGTVRALRPDVIVNAAAYTAVDKAESDADAAHAVNALAPGVLAEEAERIGAWLVHFSTDYVFDGSGDRPWCEGDATAPLNAYGHSKREGEALITARCSRHLILRTSWVFGSRGGNFARTMLRLAQERERMTVVDDQFGAPTGADLLADVTAHAIHQARRDASLAGLYHVAAAGQTTWFAYATHVIEAARRAWPHGGLTVEELVPVASSAFPTPARRPHNSRLDSTRFESAFGLVLPDWQQGVDRLLAGIL